MTLTPVPVVFIHGLWLHASSWQPWVELFTEAGYQPIAPGWPGVPDTVEAARADPDSIADHGIEDVTRHYAAIIDTLPAKPILVGHSFGGMIAEKLLGEDRVAPRSPSTPRRSRGYCRCRCHRCGRPCPSSRTRPTYTAPYR